MALWNSAEDPNWFSLTVTGKATSMVLSLWSRQSPGAHFALCSGYLSPRGQSGLLLRHLQIAAADTTTKITIYTSMEQIGWHFDEYFWCIVSFNPQTPLWGRRCCEEKKTKLFFRQENWNVLVVTQKVNQASLSLTFKSLLLNGICPRVSDLL